MTASLDLAPEHRRIVLDIIAEHLPPKTQAWVFGSRATGRARRYSDLDLALDAGRRLTIDETAILREAFDECDLPYRSRRHRRLWQATDDRFLRQLIAAERPASYGQPYPLLTCSLHGHPPDAGARIASSRRSCAAHRKRLYLRYKGGMNSGSITYRSRAR